MKTLFTTRMALIALIFGSSGYGIKALFPIGHYPLFQWFPSLGFVFAALSSFLVSVLIPRRIKKVDKKWYNLGLIVLFFISILSCFVVLRMYETHIFYPKVITERNGVLGYRNSDAPLLESGFDGLTPELKEVVTRYKYDAFNVFDEGGGMIAYDSHTIWTGKSIDQIARMLLLTYFFFIISLITTTFAFLETLKNRNYSENMPAPKKSRASQG